MDNDAIRLLILFPLALLILFAFFALALLAARLSGDRRMREFEKQQRQGEKQRLSK